jgi:hypothetical protein
MSLFSKHQPPDDTIRPALDALREGTPSSLAMTDEGLVDLSEQIASVFSTELDADEAEIERTMQDVAARVAAEPAPPAYNAVTSSAWRVLEEQRGRALDVVRELNDEIARLVAKRDDAQRAADGCYAGQKAMEAADTP